MNAIDHAAAVLQRFDIQPGPMDRILRRYLADHRQITSRDRRIISEVVFCVLRWRRRIDGWLMLRGNSRCTNRDRVVAALSWRGGVTLSDGDLARLGPFPPDLMDLQQPMPRGFPGGSAAYHSFPDLLFEALVAAYGIDGAAKMAVSLHRALLPCVRVNVMRQRREDALEMLQREGIGGTPTAYSPYGIRLEQRTDLKGTRTFRDGIIELQDEASQLAVFVADPAPGERVLDLCAGAGGKSLMIAMLQQGEGRILAVDIDALKLQELRRRAARARASGIETVSAQDLGRTEAFGQELFDLVLVDAPCSGTGTIRRNPDIVWRLTCEQLTSYRDRQHELLRRGAGYVRVGGRLVYVTCSILPEENEHAVSRFLASNDAFEIMSAGDPLLRHGVAGEIFVGSEGFFHTDPRMGEWDGFFAAVMVRKV